MPPRPRATVSVGSIPTAIKKLQRRLSELEAVTTNLRIDLFGDAQRLVNAANATVDEVFGEGSSDARDFHLNSQWFSGGGWSTSEQAHSQQFQKAVIRSKLVLGDAIKRLEEWALDADEEAASRTIRAYDGLDLHPEIARAASKLYRDGHYANAIEDAVKALNAFVRLRSGVDDRDGMGLMEYVFGPKSPVLAFNGLQDDSDRDEQKGFMMMLSGAVAGLRNPRAHRLVKDSPERALEFIAYVSLLAKLVDGAEVVT
jgi:uncharacterized protein (TIGR02391 family)